MKLISLYDKSRCSSCSSRKRLHKEEYNNADLPNMGEINLNKLIKFIQYTHAQIKQNKLPKRKGTKKAMREDEDRKICETIHLLGEGVQRIVASFHHSKIGHQSKELDWKILKLINV